MNEKIKVEEIDYYYSNVIARASKTMSECRNNFLKLKKLELMDNKWKIFIH